MNPKRKIRIAAAIITNDRGQMLLVRKRASKFFIQPGGKIEPGESSEVALQRELLEELRCTPARMKFCGQFSAPAVHEPDHLVEAQFYFVELDGPVTPAAEIAEVLWIDPANPGNHALAPLTTMHALSLAMSGE
jgi:mutator protein MutT